LTFGVIDDDGFVGFDSEDGGAAGVAISESMVARADGGEVERHFLRGLAHF